jgi:hypothetical protein
MAGALALACLLFLLAGCRWAGFAGAIGAHRKAGDAPVASDATTTMVLSPVNGMPMAEEMLTHRPLAVMVENLRPARPQSGLTQADVVYEAITEGGITRFLAIFVGGNPPVIGPVRSARPHFINIAREYQAVYVHCGESYEALQILSADSSIFNLDQMQYDAPFWRDHTRSAPHNLYTSATRLRQCAQRLRWDAPVSPLPSFNSNQPLPAGLPATRVEIHFPGAVDYRLQLVYNPQLGGYERYEDGKLHVDRETGQPIVAKNVVIQRVAAFPFLDSAKGTLDVGVVGSGEGVFFCAGEQLALSWSKPNNTSITNFQVVGTNVPAPFQCGQTWVEIVPEGGKVTIQ